MGIFRSGQGRSLIRTTKRSVSVVLHRRWGVLLVIMFSGLISGAVATSFAELTSMVANSRILERSSSADNPFFRQVERYSPTSSWLSDLIMRSGHVTSIAAVMAIAVLLAAVIALINAVTGKARASVNAEIYKQLRNDAFNRCFDQISAVDLVLTSEGALDAKGNVTLATAINRGADSVSSTYTYLLTCIQQGFALVSALVTSGSKIFPVTAACLLVIVAQILLSRWLARSLRSNRKELDTSTNVVQSQTAELLNAREVLLAFDKSDKYKRVLRNLVDRVGDTQARMNQVEARYDALQELVRNWGQLAVMGSAILLILVIPRLVIDPHPAGPESSALIYAITLYTTLLSPARQLINGYDFLRRSEAVVGSFLAIFSIEDDVGQGGRSQGWQADQPIVIDRVTYTPPGGDEPVIRDLDLVIEPNTTTLILGPSGCGKTTLGRLCIGFLEPDTGTIRIGGAPLRDWSSPYLYKAISYAPQVDQVLGGSIEENLRLAEDDKPFDAACLERVLDMVRLKCGEAGRLARDAKSLSGGETQRLSAARLLLDHAEILLLDEPMAGVDIFTMADIAPAIEKHWRETRQTVLLISHKLVFAGLATQVVIMDENGIAEIGDPRELAQQNSIYAKLRAEALSQAGAN